jgi:hypothetical protein
MKQARGQVLCCHKQYPILPNIEIWKLTMARPLRIEFPGGLYHVTSRGDRREEIYLDDADRVNWLTLARSANGLTGFAMRIA